MANQEDPDTSSRFVWSDNKVIRRFFAGSATCNGAQRNDFAMEPGVCTQVLNSQAYVKAHYVAGQSLVDAVRKFDSNSSGAGTFASMLAVMVVVSVSLLF